MEIKISINVSRDTKPVAKKSINAYKNIFQDLELSEISESIQSLQQGFLDINRRLRHFEEKLRKV